MAGRVLRAQQDVLARYKRISNLYIAYVNSDLSPEEFGREFVFAVGDILEGKTVDQLELFHIDVAEIEDVVSHGRGEGIDEKAERRRPYRRPAFRHVRLRRG